MLPPAHVIPPDGALLKLYRTLADTRDEIPESSQKPATPNINRPINFSAAPSTSHAVPSTSATPSTSTSRPTQDQATPSTSKDALSQCSTVPVLKIKLHHQHLRMCQVVTISHHLGLTLKKYLHLLCLQRKHLQLMQERNPSDEEYCPMQES